MQTQITKNGDIIIVRLKGVADFESIVSLDKTCEKYFIQKKIIFNLADLNFVGSSGLSNLTEIIKKLTHQSSFKICNVGNELLRIFNSSRLENLEIYEDENSAQQSFTQS